MTVSENDINENKKEVTKKSLPKKSDTTVKKKDPIKENTIPLSDFKKLSETNSNNPTFVGKDVHIFKNGKNTIVYPIFSDCIKYTTDDFWKNLFEELSYGKCPKSIYISNNTIYSSNKRKGFSYMIPTRGTKNSKEVFNEIREVLINNTSICSAVDVIAKKAEMKENQDDEITSKTTWSEIKKKNLREILIIKFVGRMKKKHNLTWESARHLYSLIQIGFMIKTQNSKDVHFRNKRIESIDGIVFSEKDGHFNNDYIKNETPKEKDEVEDPDNYLYYYWDRFVSTTMKQL